MRTLLLDQSSSCIGFAILDDKSLFKHGDLKPTKALAKAPARLYELQKDLEDLVSLFQPNEMVLEWHHYPAMKSLNAIEGTANSAGICNMVAAINCIPVYRVRNQRWQSACGARGRKETIKQDVQRIACNFWNLNRSEIRSFDHSDALGMAAAWSMLADDLREEWRKALSTRNKGK